MNKLTFNSFQDLCNHLRTITSKSFSIKLRSTPDNICICGNKTCNKFHIVNHSGNRWFIDSLTKQISEENDIQSLIYEPADGGRPNKIDIKDWVRR